MSLNPAGRLLAFGDQYGITYVWDTDSRRPVETVTNPDSAGVDSIAFNVSNSIMAVGDDNGDTDIYPVGLDRK
jgi:WD40 repeat protein